jgi:hypothetical protein
MRRLGASVLAVVVAGGDVFLALFAFMFYWAVLSVMLHAWPLDWWFTLIALTLALCLPVGLVLSVGVAVMPAHAVDGLCLRFRRASYYSLVPTSIGFLGSVVVFFECAALGRISIF